MLSLGYLNPSKQLLCFLFFVIQPTIIKEGGGCGVLLERGAHLHAGIDVGHVVSWVEEAVYPQLETTAFFFVLR